jgi:hypothetical protein
LPSIRDLTGVLPRPLCGAVRSEDKNRFKDKKHAFSPHSLPLPIATHRDVEKAEIAFRVGAVLKK